MHLLRFAAAERIWRSGEYFTAAGQHMWDPIKINLGVCVRV